LRVDEKVCKGNKKLISYLAADVAGIGVPTRVTPKPMVHLHVARLLLCYYLTNERIGKLPKEKSN
jgi:hypothetical protein